MDNDKPLTISQKDFVLRSITHMKSSGLEVLFDIHEDCWKPSCDELDEHIIRTLKEIDAAYTRLRNEEYVLATHAYYSGFLSPASTIGFVEGGGFPKFMRAPPHILEWELWDTKKIYRDNPSPIEFYLMIAAKKGGSGSGNKISYSLPSTGLSKEERDYEKIKRVRALLSV